MELEQIRPQYGTFKLAATGEHEYKLRKFSLDDQIWVKTATGRRLDEIISSDDPTVVADGVAQVVYHLLEDRTKFKKQEVTIIDENGEEQLENLGGFRLFCRMVCGPKEQMAILEALLKTLGGSNPEKSQAEKKRELRSKKPKP